MSRLERADDLNLSTLERYVAALRGKFYVDARIGDDVIELAPTGRRSLADGTLGDR